MITGAAYIANPRQCPACKAAQEPRADSIITPVLRTCACGLRWTNVFRNRKLVGYDPKGNNK